MKHHFSRLLLLSLLILVPESSSLASPFQPWRPGKPGSSGKLSPVKWTPSPAAPVAPAGKDTAENIRKGPATLPASPSSTRPASMPASQAASRPAGLATEGDRCESDEVCVAGTFCDNGYCVKVKRPFNPLGLYLVYRSDDGRFTQLFGIYWHKQGVQGYQVVFPFYWHFWENEKQTRMVFPFYYSYSSPKEQIESRFYGLFQHRRTPRETNYRLWPIVFYTDYGKRGAGLTVLPFFHFAREGSRRSTIIPLLLSGYNRDPDRDTSSGLILGIFYWRRAETESATGVFPLFYRSSSPEESFTWVLPLNFHWRKGKDRTTMILPFVYRRASPKQSTILSLVPPFYYSREGESTFFLGGPIYRRSGPDRKSFGVLPLFFSGETRLSSYAVLFPVFWQFGSPYHSFTLAGPFFHYRRRHRVTAGVFPLALYRKNRDRSSLISPLVLYENDRKAKVRQLFVLAPPFYHRRDPDRAVDTLFPLFMRWHDRTEDSTTWLFGPVVWYSDPEGGTQVVFPFFWRFSDRKTGAATSFLFPLAYRHVRPDGGQFNLFFPFYYKERARSWGAGLLPLLYLGSSPGKRHAVLFPVFWHWKNTYGTTTALGPIYWRSVKDGWHAGVAPLFFAGRDGGESYQVLFPAFWHLRSKKEGYNTYVAGPFFWSDSRKGKVFGLLPVFAAGTWKGTSFQAVLPPLFYHSDNEKEGKSFLLAGPYLGWRSPGVRGHAILPVAYYRRSAPRTTAFVLPLFYYRREKKDRLLLTPIGGVHRNDDTGVHEGMAGPFVWHHGPKARGFGVIPLFVHYTRPKEQSTTTVVLPIGVRHVSPKETALVWFPFFWRFTNPKERSLVVFPVYWRLRQEGELQADVVFPLYWRLRNHKTKKSLDVVGPFFMARKKDSIQIGLFPLFYYRKHKHASRMYALPFIYHDRDWIEKRHTWVYGPFYYRRYEKGYATGLMPLFWRKNTPDQKYTIVAPLFWDLGDPKKQTRIVFGGPFFYRRKPGVKAVGLAPISYFSWEKDGARTWAMVPLFYHRKEVARWALYTPLFGYDRSTKGRQWYAGPYFQRRHKKSAIDTLIPVFFRHRDRVSQQTTLLSLPGYYGRWSPEKSFHLVFPIFWRHRTIDTTTNVVFPLFWDFNNHHASRTTILFPFLLYHRNHRKQHTHLFIPPGFWLQRKQQSYYNSIWFPLVWHFSDPKETFSLAFPLYIDLKRPGKRATVFFPLVWRFEKGPVATYFIANSYYTRDREKKTYKFIFFPLFTVERKRPGDFKIGFLGDFVGYERVGRNRMMYLFFKRWDLEPADAEPRVKGKKSAAVQRRPGYFGSARRANWNRTF